LKGEDENSKLKKREQKENYTEKHYKIKNAFDMVTACKWRTVMHQIQISREKDNQQV
jgi:hypothetical protein